jgi:DNA-binding transcriptional MerR regulator
MRIGELARRVGVSTDAIRFYEREGLVPKPERHENGYREYADTDVDHLRLLIDLRSLDVPLEQAANVATMCHSGHCVESTRELPALIDRQRTVIAERMARLQLLDERLADLGGHLDATRHPLLPLIADGACCDAASAVMTAGKGRCSCCSPVA